MYYNLIPLMNKIAPIFTVATGGTITTVGDYKVHVFNASLSGREDNIKNIADRKI